MDHIDTIKRFKTKLNSVKDKDKTCSLSSLSLSLYIYIYIGFSLPFY